MALPKEWWKEGDLRAGGKGLTGLVFGPDLFQTWGKPQYADATGMGDSDPRMVDPWHSQDNPLYKDSNGWSNYQFEKDPTTGQMSLVVKSGDKEGTRYRLDGSPDKGFTVGDVIEVGSWNTNTPGTYYLKAFAPFAAAAAAAALAPAAGGAGAAATGAGELTAAQIAEIVAAEGGFSALPSFGATGAVPFSTSVANIGLGDTLKNVIGEAFGGLGTTGGGAAELTAEQIAEIVAAEGGYSSLPSFGATGAVPFSTSVANIGLGSTVANMVGDAVGGLGSAAKTVGGAVANAASGAAGASTGGSIAKGLFDLISGWYQQHEGKDAAERMFTDQMAAAGDYKQAGLDYAAGLRDMIPGLAEAYSYMPATVDNGVAQSYVDPVTGQVGFTLNEPYQDMHDRYLGMAGGMMDELANTDPNAMAKRMYDERMALIAPQREQQQQDLLQQLYAKGGYGLSLNTPTQLGNMAVNPYVNSFSASNAQNDRQMAYDSWQQGQGYIDSLLGRQRGLMGDAYGILNAGNSALDSANRWGNTFTGNNQAVANAVYGTQRDALGAERSAVQDYINAVLGYQNQRTGANAAASQARTGAFTDVAKSLPWENIWRGVSGLFGGN